MLSAPGSALFQSSTPVPRKRFSDTMLSGFRVDDNRHIGADCDCARGTIPGTAAGRTGNGSGPSPLVGVAPGSRHGPAGTPGRKRGQLLVPTGGRTGERSGP